jgi:hypothetical protein
MVMLTPRGLKIGTVIDKTLGVIEHNIPPVLVFAVVLTAVTSGMKYFALGKTAALDLLAVVLIGVAVGIVAGYALLEAMVRRTGLRGESHGDTFLPFVGLSILATIGVGLGFIAVIIPGLVIMARWSIAQPLLLVRGGGVMKALSDSWERTSGAEFQYLVALFALMLPLIAVMIACSVMFDPADLVGIAIAQLASAVMSVISAAMAVAMYGLLVGNEEAAAFA